MSKFGAEPLGPSKELVAAWLESGRAGAGPAVATPGPAPERQQRRAEGTSLLPVRPWPQPRERKAAVGRRREIGADFDFVAFRRRIFSSPSSVPRASPQFSRSTVPTIR